MPHFKIPESLVPTAEMNLSCSILIVGVLLIRVPVRFFSSFGMAPGSSVLKSDKLSFRVFVCFCFF